MSFLDRFKPGEKRRDEDKAVREFLSRKLEDASGQLRAMATEAGRGKGALEKAPAIAELNRRHDVLERLLAELRHASYGDWGYRGGPDKLAKRADDERRLALITEFDEALATEVEALGKAVADLGPALAEAGNEPFARGLKALDGRLGELQQRLRQREELLKNPERVDWPDHQRGPGPEQQG